MARPTIEELLTLKKERNELLEKISRIRGRIEQARDGATKEEVRDKLIALQQERVELEQKWQKLYVKYRRDYARLFGGQEETE